MKCNRKLQFLVYINSYLQIRLWHLVLLWAFHGHDIILITIVHNQKKSSSLVITKTWNDTKQVAELCIEIMKEYVTLIVCEPLRNEGTDFHGRSLHGQLLPFCSWLSCGHTMGTYDVLSTWQMKNLPAYSRNTADMVICTNKCVDSELSS